VFWRAGSRIPEFARERRAARQADLRILFDRANMRSFRSLSFVVALAAFTSTSAVLASAAESLVHLGSRAVGTVTVTRTGNVYSLRFSGDEVIDYRVDLDLPYAADGRVTVYEASSDCSPMVNTSPGYRDAANVQRSTGWLASFATLTSQTMTSNSVILDFTDDFTPIGEGIRHRRTTFTLTGKMLSVRFQDMDGSTSFLRNYLGVLQGTGLGFDSPQILKLMGGVSQPIVKFEGAGRTYYTSNILDFFTSNAADYFATQTPVVPAPGTTSLAYNYSTWGNYKQLTNGSSIGAAVDDTFQIVVTSKVHEAFVVPSQKASPYRELLTNRMVLLLHGVVQSNYPPFWDKLDLWGVDNIAAYVFLGWSAGAADPPAPHAGPDWWPAADPTAFAATLQGARTKGFLIGAYNTYGTLPPTAPLSVNDPAMIARDATGAAKVDYLFGLPMLASTACGIHAARESTFLRNAGATMGYLDVQVNASPTRGADGDHIDQRAGSPWAKTLKTACADQHTWMRQMQETYSGPLLGEGSFIASGSNFELLWAGFCDSTQRSLNIGTDIDPWTLPNTRRGWALTPTGWPVVPEIEWRVFSQLQVNHGNGFPERFFSPPDGPGFVTATAPIYPMNDAMLDRYRVYEITYGKAGYIQTTGIPNGVGNMTYHADMLKEYHMTNALQARYTQAPPTAIEYLNGGTWKTFQRILEDSDSLEPFRNARIRLTFANGLEIYVNHGEAALNVTVGGVAYSIPEDGFVARQASTGLIAFSAVPPGTGGARIDYCLDPAAYEFFDGRGVVGAWGGQSTPYAGVQFTSFSRGRSFRENTTTNVIEQVGTTNAPALLRVEVTPAMNTLAAGSRKGLKAVAVYANGARRDVTKLVNWSSGSSSIASVNSGAAVTANAPGQTTVTVTSFQGSAVVPATVNVQ